MRFDLGHSPAINKWSDYRSFRKTIPDLDSGGGRRKPRRECLVDLILHQDAVSCDASLTSIAIFGRQRALDRTVKIGVIEHDERRVAAKLHRGLLHRAGAL